MKPLLIFISFFIINVFLSSNISHSQEISDYVCYPCGSDCDNETFFSEGHCPHCNMLLIKKSSVKFKSIDTKGLLMKLKNETGFILLDVRTVEEFNGKGIGRRAMHGYKHLKGAINISSDVFEEMIGEIMKYKDSEIIVYCSHSHRSPFCSQILTDAGFTNVTNYSGGLVEFTEEYLIDSDAGKEFMVK